jgi:U11/U12 small nuclear ribonucleoprotein SNRNP35
MSAEWHPLAVDYGVYDPLMTGSIDGTDTRPHDRAVTRAYQASYKPCLQISGDPEKTIFIGRLHMNTAEGDSSVPYSSIVMFADQKRLKKNLLNLGRLGNVR